MPQNILVIHIAGLAETTLALPALRSLRQHLPNSRITVVSTPTAVDLLQLAGCVDEVLPVVRFRHVELLKPGTFYHSTKAINEVRRSNYDIAIEFKSNTEAGILLQLANPHARLSGGKNLSRGWNTVLERIAQILTQRPPILTHVAHEYLKRLEPLGVRPLESEPRLTTDRAADEQVEKLLRKHGLDFGELLVGIHPGAGTSHQRWPIERFASIASRMIHNFNARVLVFAGPRERGSAKKITSMLPGKRAIAVESPKLADYVSAAARLSLLIANHSGPAHLAAAVGTPVVVVSMTSGPSTKDLLGKHHEHIRGSHIELISEEGVYEAACRLVKINRAEYLRTR